MAKNEDYRKVIVESYSPDSTSGLHGEVHIKPLKNQGYSQNIHVQCSKKLSDTKQYPIGTKFRIKAKLTDRLGGGEFLYSSYQWPFEVLNNEGEWVWQF